MKENLTEKMGYWKLGVYETNIFFIPFFSPEWIGERRQKMEDVTQEKNKPTFVKVLTFLKLIDAWSTLGVRDEIKTGFV
jgi:hypothetical protein